MCCHRTDAIQKIKIEPYKNECKLVYITCQKLDAQQNPSTTVIGDDRCDKQCKKKKRKEKEKERKKESISTITK